MPNPLEQHLQAILDKKKAAHHYRTLRLNDELLIDFCSNDYLGLSASAQLHERILNDISNLKAVGSTGARLLRGNYALIEETEQIVARFHRAEAALIFNSGYDANVGLFQAVARRGDVILFDEFSHASTRDGIRLSHAQAQSFKHNDIDDLERLLQNNSTGNVFIALEAVYSMDGDHALLYDIAYLAQKYGAYLVVDEAHSTGTTGKNGEGVCASLGLEQQVFARIHTFGKAMGVHGAAILGTNTLRNYLINFCRSFIYTTAMPLHTALAIKHAYMLLQEPQTQAQIVQLRQNIHLFNVLIKTQLPQVHFVKSYSPIQAWIIDGNEPARFAAQQLQKAGYDVRAILSPTVAAGSERCRICLHSFNTENQIIGLVETMKEING
jgi:8-amino-7-oxononanoate synthase